MANKTDSSPLCTGATPQRFVQKVATAQGGSGVTDLAAFSPPVSAEVMETDEPRVGLPAAGGAASKVSKYWEGMMWGQVPVSTLNHLLMTFISPALCSKASSCSIDCRSLSL